MNTPSGCGRLARVLALCACALLGDAAAQTATPAVTLAVGGSVERARVWSESDLRTLPLQRVEDVREVRMGGEAKQDTQARRYAGVLLRDVLAATKPVEKERRDLRRSIVVVTASDGYVVVFSWAELFLSPIGDGVLVVLERDGAPLPASEGPLALVSLRDTQPGPRHVKWLQKVELRRVGD
jgi:DMSO/TMAO reductase YedYZ molybdopterin-dependent catalytic subunit